MIHENGLKAVVKTRDLGGREQEFSVSVPVWSAPFSRALTAPITEVISGPNGTGSAPITIEVPRRRDGAHESSTTNADLCVAKLLDPEVALLESAGLLNKIAFIRGPQMVIKYEQSVGQKGAVPHHVGVVRMGLYSVEKSPVQEQFIADAEPPSHNNVASSRKLKSNYEVGYKKAIDSLYSQVRTIGRRLLGRDEDGSDKPPKKLDEVLAGRPPSRGKGRDPIVHPENTRLSSNVVSLVWNGEVVTVEVELSRGQLSNGKSISVAMGIVAVGENGREPLNHLPYDITKPAIVNATRMSDGKGWNVDLPPSQTKTRLVISADVSSFNPKLKPRLRAYLDLRTTSIFSPDDQSQRLR
jgi:hypothetical protein